MAVRWPAWGRLWAGGWLAGRGWARWRGGGRGAGSASVAFAALHGRLARGDRLHWGGLPPAVRRGAARGVPRRRCTRGAHTPVPATVTFSVTSPVTFPPASRSGAGASGGGAPRPGSDVHPAARRAGHPAADDAGAARTPGGSLQVCVRGTWPVPAGVEGACAGGAGRVGCVPRDACRGCGYPQARPASPAISPGAPNRRRDALSRQGHRGRSRPGGGSVPVPRTVRTRTMGNAIVQRREGQREAIAGGRRAELGGARCPEGPAMRSESKALRSRFPVPCPIILRTPASGPERDTRFSGGGGGRGTVARATRPCAPPAKSRCQAPRRAGGGLQRAGLRGRQGPPVDTSPGSAAPPLDRRSRPCQSRPTADRRRGRAARPETSTTEARKRRSPNPYRTEPGLTASARRGSHTGTGLCMGLCLARPSRVCQPDNSGHAGRLSGVPSAPCVMGTAVTRSAEVGP